MRFAPGDLIVPPRMHIYIIYSKPMLDDTPDLPAGERAAQSLGAKGAPVNFGRERRPIPAIGLCSAARADGGVE